VLRYREHRPGPDLRPHVECLWTVTDTLVRSGRAPERVLPDGCPELIVHLGDPFARLIGSRWVAQPRAFLVGTLTRPWLLRAGRRVETVGIRFRPGATTTVFPISMIEARDREVRLTRLVGAAPAAALIGRIRRARANGERFAVIEDWLRSRLAGTRARGTTARARPEANRRRRPGARLEPPADRAGIRAGPGHPSQAVRQDRPSQCRSREPRRVGARERRRPRIGGRLFRPGPPLARLPSPGGPRSPHGSRDRRRTGPALHAPGAPARVTFLLARAAASYFSKPGRVTSP
jgi:hypothetical protein